MLILAVSVSILVLSLIASQPNNPANRALASLADAVLPAPERDYDKLLEALGAYAADSITPEADEHVMKVVEDTIDAYDLDKEGTLARINALEADYYEYPFVLDPHTRTVVAHGALPERVGDRSTLFSEGADRPADAILSDLLEGGEGTGVWLEYLFFDVNLNTDQLKRSWMVLHDGLVFGAGHYYSAELRVKHEVDKAIFMYDYQKDLAFDYINSLAEVPYTYYVVVIDIKSAEVRAHGAFPDDTVGAKVSQSREGLTDLEYGNAFWLFVQNKNPMTGLIDQKRVWTVAHDGHYFSSGYYYHAEDKAKFIVDRTVELYQELGREGVFAQINAMESDDPTYPFIIDLPNNKTRAHGAYPDYVGLDPILITTDSENVANLLANSTAWVDYIFENPRTDELEHKRTYQRLYDGHIFGSGFYYTIFGVSQAE